MLDNAFTELERDADGRARVLLDDPARGAGLTLWVDESYRYLMVFTGDPLPRRRQAQPRGRADDVSAERVPHGRLADPSRAGRVDREQLGDRAATCGSGRSRCPVTDVRAS